MESKRDIYVISSEGLSLAPHTGPAVPPKHWNPWVVQGNGIKDWLSKLKKKCNSL